VPEKDGLTADEREMHNENLHSLYSPLDIIRKIKSRRMRKTVHVARRRI
jgi:hypothetical protein